MADKIVFDETDKTVNVKDKTIIITKTVASDEKVTIAQLLSAYKSICKQEKDIADAKKTIVDKVNAIKKELKLKDSDVSLE